LDPVTAPSAILAVVTESFFSLAVVTASFLILPVLIEFALISFEPIFLAA
jgi:hypothetical protein